MDTRSDLILQLALAEDRARHDVTTRTLIGTRQSAKAVIVAKEKLVIAGLPMARRVFQFTDSRIRFNARVREGSVIPRGKVVAELSGSAQGILSGERTALNILQHLSGIATMTRRVVRAIRRTKVEVWDTRKTHAGLRVLEKYAVRVGGGKNHRESLADQFFIKDNHIALCGGIKNALRKISATSRRSAIVEVRNLSEAIEAVKLGARKILLDNQKPNSLKRTVRALRKIDKNLWLEASGGITPENAVAYAKTGVDAISLGALTHSPQAANLSLEILVRGVPPRPSGRA